MSLQSSGRLDANSTLDGGAFDGFGTAVTALRHEVDLGRLPVLEAAHGEVQFIHLSFQEFLAGNFISRQLQKRGAGKQFADAVECCRFAIAACDARDAGLALERLKRAFEALS